MTEKVITSQKALDDYMVYLQTKFDKHKYLRVSDKVRRKRTLTQNNCIHKLCELLAEALNDAGFDFRAFVKDGYEVPFTPELVKDHLWRPIQVAMTGKKSTTELTTIECSDVYDVLNRKTAEYGIHVSWPSRDVA